MTELQLTRVSVLAAGAFGVLLCDGVPFAVTLEHTYGPDNHVKIPPGEYLCHRTKYHRGGYETFEIPVPGHSRILFHRANTEIDLDGCVGVAKTYGMFGDAPGVASSKVGFSEFMGLTEGHSTVKLTVKEA